MPRKRPGPKPGPPRSPEARKADSDFVRRARERVRQARGEPVTQADFGKLIGRSKSLVDQMENGRVRVTDDVRTAITDALACIEVPRHVDHQPDAAHTVR